MLAFYFDKTWPSTLFGSPCARETADQAENKDPKD